MRDHHPAMDIVVPVCRGHDARARCCASLEASTPGDDVRFLADDASPGERISPLLERYAAQDAGILRGREHDLEPSWRTVVGRR